jgi:DNA-binding NtrC family response regulator
MVKQGAFREDLFYRLNVVPIYIPSLRQRVRDLELLAQHFLETSCDSNGKAQKSFSDEAKAKLLRYDWPGNVRELENIIERSVLLTSGDVIQSDDLQIEIRESKSVPSLGPGMTVFEAEKLLIFKTLEYTGHNKTHAAKMLGISVRTLRNKLHEYRGEQNEQDLR